MSYKTGCNVFLVDSQNCCSESQLPLLIRIDFERSNAVLIVVVLEVGFLKEE